MTAVRKAQPKVSDLERLFRAIANGDRAAASEMIAASPPLAMEATRVGATRADESHFLEPIGRHVYAGDTALHIAAAAHDAEIVRQLLDAGADPTATNRRGATPVHSASVGNPESPRWNPSGQATTIGVLIDAGADPNATDMDGVSSLHRAVRTRCAAAVQTLLARGADVHQTNHSGSTPLHLAVQTTGRGGSGSAAAHMEQAAIIRLLVGHGARVGDTDGRGRTAYQASTSDRIRDLIASQPADGL